MSGKINAKCPGCLLCFRLLQNLVEFCCTDQFRPPLRPVLDKPLRLCMTDVFKAMGAGVAVAGMIHTGSVQVGDRVVVVPAGESATVKGLHATHHTACIVIVS